MGLQAEPDDSHKEVKMATSPSRHHPVRDCWVDGTACEVIGLLDCSSVDVESDADDLLPCNRCRAAECAIDRLTGQKLGRHQRGILLGARRPAEPPAPLPQLDSTHSAQVAHTRALRSLEALGLIELTWCRQRDESGRTRRLRSARLTPVGAAIADEYRDLLTSGSRIRWSASRLLSRCRLDTTALTAVFAANLQEAIELRQHLVAGRQSAGREEEEDFTRALTDLHLLLDACERITTAPLHQQQQ